MFYSWCLNLLIYSNTILFIKVVLFFELKRSMYNPLALLEKSKVLQLKGNAQLQLGSDDDIFFLSNGVLFSFLDLLADLICRIGPQT